MPSTTNLIYNQKELQLLINETIENFYSKQITFIPVYLYIKQHSITGKLYFGKTTRDLNFLLEEYHGSGLYWQKHINMNNINFVETIWYCLFYDVEDLVTFALNYSNNHNLGSDLSSYLNLRFENGLDGGSVGRIMDEKDRTTIAKSVSKQWKDLTPDEYDIRCKSMSIGKALKRSMRSEEESTEITKRISDASKEAHKRKSKEQLEQESAKSKKTRKEKREAMSDEEKRLQFEKRSITSKATYENMSTQDLINHSRKTSEGRKKSESSMTSEQLDERKLRYSVAQKGKMTGMLGYNNGIITKRLYPGTEPDGWVPGYAPRIKSRE